MSASSETSETSETNETNETDETSKPDGTAWPAVIPALPTEVLSQIGSYLYLGELAECMLVSNAFLNIFGRITYTPVALYNIQKRDGTPPTSIRKRLLSFVEAIEIHPHGFHDYACADIAKLCTNLRIISGAPSRGFLCGLSGLCGCLPTDGRKLKFVIQSDRGPCIGIREGFHCKSHRVPHRDMPDYPVPHTGICGALPECVTAVVVDFKVDLDRRELTVFEKAWKIAFHRRQASQIDLDVSPYERTSLIARLRRSHHEVCPKLAPIRHSPFLNLRPMA